MPGPVNGKCCCGVDLPLTSTYKARFICQDCWSELAKQWESGPLKNIYPTFTHCHTCDTYVGPVILNIKGPIKIKVVERKVIKEGGMTFCSIPCREEINKDKELKKEYEDYRTAGQGERERASEARQEVQTFES